jgi:hypothetical protein
MCPQSDQTKLTALWPARYTRNANFLNALSPSLPLTSILSRSLHCKSLPRTDTCARCHISLWGVTLTHRRYVANLAVVRQPHKQANEENPLQRSIIIMQQSLAHFQEGIVRAIQSAWQTLPPSPLITSGYPFLPALIIFSTPIHLFGIPRSSAIQAGRIHRSSQCIRLSRAQKAISRTRIASLTLFSPHPGFCTSSVPLTRHRGPPHFSLFSHLVIPLVPPPVQAPNPTI